MCVQPMYTLIGMLLGLCPRLSVSNINVSESLLCKGQRDIIIGLVLLTLQCYAMLVRLMARNKIMLYPNYLARVRLYCLAKTDMALESRNMGNNN